MKLKSVTTRGIRTGCLVNSKTVMRKILHGPVHGNRFSAW